MNALSDLELFLNSNSEYLFHVSFIPSLTEFYGENITVIDETDKFITYKDKEEIHYTIPFSSWVISQVVKRISTAINQIDSDIIELSKDNKDPTEYVKLISTKIGILIDNLPSDDYYSNTLPFLEMFKERFDKLKDYGDFSKNKKTLVVNSFNWYGQNSEQNLSEIKNLYNLLTKSPPLIECSEQEFINAFTNQPVKSGIKWLVKGRNKDISKSSLFYLIEQLVELEVLDDFTDMELNSKIPYVFRDQFGNYLRNIRISKAKRSSNPAQGERIRNIYIELKKTL